MICTHLILGHVRAFAQGGAPHAHATRGTNGGNITIEMKLLDALKNRQQSFRHEPQVCAGAWDVVIATPHDAMSGEISQTLIVGLAAA